MKICFICGSLEPGKDGVGDYSRRLAGELIRLGHQASIISINDSFVASIDEVFQMDEDTCISCLRIPARLRKDEKIKKVDFKEALENFRYFLTYQVPNSIFIN